MIPPAKCHEEPALPDLSPPLGALLASAPPDLSDAEAMALARLHFGLEAEPKRLTSERDLNLLLRDAKGAGYVLKIANRAEPHAVTTFQTEALLHLESTAPDLCVPRVLRTLDGATEVTLANGSLLRVLTYLEGTPLHLAPRSGTQRRAMGRVLADLSRALASFTHPAAEQDLLWDIRHAARLRPLLPSCPDPASRDLSLRCLDIFEAEVAPLLPTLPWQVVHNDLNPHNVLVDPQNPDAVAGVLDFGDMVRTARVCDLAVAAAYQIDPEDALGSLTAFVAGYHEAYPLLPEEVDVLFDLTATRMITTIGIASSRAASHPENAPYILRNFPAARTGLQALTALPRDAARRALRQTCGME
ncbi:phosphotransferase [Cereibacter changlensis]|uniref:Hydroxylysine kinase n=1 Tax=Cereibacter changlensis TaxID=402884 RepID=A0A2W7R1N2_9RHOB|nr:phosphotransferase [Cereibacter changlensis]PZX54464.1 hypothetical protein LX76_02111 [Cereibacter changlensis]